MVAKGFVLPAGDGITETFRPGEVFTWKLHTATSGDALEIAEVTIAPKINTFQHVHAANDEIFYILEGRLRFKLEDEEEMAMGAGGTVFIPRTKPHSWCCDEDAKVLIMFTPAGMEGYFQALTELRAGITAGGEQAGAARQKAVEEIQRRFSTRTVGPRLT